MNAPVLLKATTKASLRDKKNSENLHFDFQPTYLKQKRRRSATKEIDMTVKIST